MIILHGYKLLLLISSQLDFTCPGDRKGRKPCKLWERCFRLEGLIKRTGTWRNKLQRIVWTQLSPNEEKKKRQKNCYCNQKLLLKEALLPIQQLLTNKRKISLPTHPQFADSA